MKAEMMLITLVPYFDYLFEDIAWDYDFLNPLEQEVLSRELFKELKKLKNGNI
ncbi:MAG: hypothetical protein ACOH2V_01020 [Candidatus Saccharimonadaceae bacterium]